MGLILGAVQFGVAYGIANKAGKPPLDQAFEVFDRAWESGVRILDSAQAYGDANAVIAAYHAQSPNRFRVINKTLRNAEPVAAVYDALARERDAMRIDHFECVMFHHAATIGADIPDDFFAQLSARGITERSGLSMELPRDYEGLRERFLFDVVQLPSNPINQKFITPGFIESLAQAGVDVHVRTAFLQGLLLSGATVPPYLAGLSPLIDRMAVDAAAQGISMLEACFLFQLQNEAVGNVVVGAQDAQQWQEIAAAYERAQAIRTQVSLPWADYACADFSLSFPLQWLKLNAVAS